MLAIRKEKPEPGIELKEIPPPSPNGNEVVVEVKAAGICGSDIHISDWTPDYQSLEKELPMTLGHEFSGKVADIGDYIKDLEVGDRVVISPAKGCGRCIYCLTGREALCEDFSAVSGGFAKYVSVPVESCFQIGDMPYLSSALTEPLATGLTAVEKINPKPGETVVIIGCGMMGTSLAYFLSREGLHVTIAGLSQDEHKFELLKDIGCDRTINVEEKNLANLVKKDQRYVQGTDYVFEATGISETIQEGLDLLKPGGELVSAGTPEGRTKINARKISTQSISLKGSMAYDIEYFIYALKLIKSNSSLLKRIVKTYNIKDAVEAFESVRQKKAIKIMFTEFEDND